MIFIFLSCREKAHDNKKFSGENSKPRRESRIKSNPDNFIKSEDVQELLRVTIDPKLLKIILTNFAKRPAEN